MEQDPDGSGVVVRAGAAGHRVRRVVDEAVGVVGHRAAAEEMVGFALRLLGGAVGVVEAGQQLDQFADGVG